MFGEMRLRSKRHFVAYHVSFYSTTRVFPKGASAGP